MAARGRPGPLSCETASVRDSRADSFSMSLVSSSCRAVLCLPLALALLAGCAARTRPTADASGPDPADAEARRLAIEAREAYNAGHLVAALGLYAETASLANDVDLRRRALLAQGLLHLQPEPAVLDIEQARAALVHAHSLYGATAAPAELTAMLWTLDELRRVRSALAEYTSAAAAANQAARGADARLRQLSDENRSLRRTVEQLQGEVDKRDAALTKAVQALVDRPRSH
jgi:hypothetical protein